MRIWLIPVILSPLGIAGCASDANPSTDAETPSVALANAGDQPTDPVASEIERLAEAYRNIGLSSAPHVHPTEDSPTPEITPTTIAADAPPPIAPGTLDTAPRVENVLGVPDETQTVRPDPPPAADDAGADRPSADAEPQPAGVEPIEDAVAGLILRLAEVEPPTYRESLTRALLAPMSSDADQSVTPPESLTLDQRQLVELASRIVRSLTTEGASAAEAAETIRKAAEAIEGAQPMRVSRLELCTSVTGFGQYDTFAGNRFRAGRAQRVIIYTELDRVTQNAAESAEFRVDLSHTIILSKDGVQQRSWPAERLASQSRQQRRDFFVVRMIELPPNLTIGSYDLKVMIDDNLGGAHAEQLAKIHITVDQ